MEINQNCFGQRKRELSYTSKLNGIWGESGLKERLNQGI